MDVASKYKIVEKIIQSDNDEILNKIKSLLETSESNYWTELPDRIKMGY